VFSLAQWEVKSMKNSCHWSAMLLQIVTALHVIIALPSFQSNTVIAGNFVTFLGENTFFL
jgi:hypothetical protein